MHLITIKLENVAISNALQLETARRRASPYSHVNYDAHAKFEVAQPTRCSY